MLHKENKYLNIQREGDGGNEHFAPGPSGGAETLLRWFAHSHWWT